jgi:hypothetical protein
MIESGLAFKFCYKYTNISAIIAEGSTSSILGYTRALLSIICFQSSQVISKVTILSSLKLQLPIPQISERIRRVVPDIEVLRPYGFDVFCLVSTSIICLGPTQLTFIMQHTSWIHRRHRRTLPVLLIIPGRAALGPHAALQALNRVAIICTHNIVFHGNRPKPIISISSVNKREDRLT